MIDAIDGQPSVGPSARALRALPSERSGIPGRMLYGDLGQDEVGRLLSRVRDGLFAVGLSERSIYVYLGAIWDAELWCREQGSSLEKIPGEVIAALAASETPAVRRQLRTALGHFWRIVRRVDPPLDFLVVATTAGDIVQFRSYRKRGHPWDSGGSPAARRLLEVRDGMQRAELGARSIEVYLRQLWALERWCRRQRLSLLDISPVELERYVMSAVSNSPWNRRQLRSALKHYWRVLGRTDPPLWAVRVPRKPRMICRALEEDEAAVLAAAARADHDKRGAAVLVALHLGLRREEIARLRWADFDDGWLSLVGKGDLPARLPVHPIVWEALSWLPRRGSWVFPGRSVIDPVTGTTVWGWTRELAEESGLERITPHRLRHTCLATANDATGDLRAVQEFARHARPETTAGYTRATGRRLVAVMNSIQYEEVHA